MASAAFGATPATCAWQAQHLVLLELLLHDRRNTLTLWGLPARAGTPLAGAAFDATRATLAWQAQHFVLLEHFSVAGAALGLSEECGRV